MIRSIHLALLVLIAVTLTPTHNVFADTGPKPTMDFTFVFATAESNIVSGILFECNQSDCSDASPIADLGAQGLYCEPDGCRAIAYGFAPYHILEIEFADGITRRSNVFETVGFDSFYTVTVNPQDLRVEPQVVIGGLPASLVAGIACLVGAVVFGLGGMVYIMRRKAKA